MPIKSLIRETISLQGFRIDSVDIFSFGIGIKIAPDYRFNHRCGRCGKPGGYRQIIQSFPVFVESSKESPRLGGVNRETPVYIKRRKRMASSFFVDLRVEGTLDVWPAYYPGSDVDEKYHFFINHPLLSVAEVLLKMVFLRCDIYFLFPSFFCDACFPFRHRRFHHQFPLRAAGPL